LNAMKRSGLKVFSSLGNAHLRKVQCTDNTADIGPVDIVIIAVKLWATADAIQAAESLLSDKTGIISFQNGIIAEQQIQGSLPRRSRDGGRCKHRCPYRRARRDSA
jgi:2-dehydropantoate 2-reductase